MRIYLPKMWVFSITDTYLWIFNLIGVNIFMLMRIHKGGTFLPLPNEVSHLCRSGTGEFSNASHRLQFIANTPFFKQALLIQDAKNWHNIMVPNCWWRVSNLKVNFVFKLFFSARKTTGKWFAVQDICQMAIVKSTF